MLYFDFWTILVQGSFDDSSYFVHVNINIFIKILTHTTSGPPVATIGHFTLTGENEAGVDLVLMQPFLLSYGNHAVVMLITSILVICRYLFICHTITIITKRCQKKV